MSRGSIQLLILPKRIQGRMNIQENEYTREWIYKRINTREDEYTRESLRITDSQKVKSKTQTAVDPCSKIK